jgi:hypothetical protein
MQLGVLSGFFLVGLVRPLIGRFFSLLKRFVIGVTFLIGLFANKFTYLSAKKKKKKEMKNVKD